MAKNEHVLSSWSFDGIQTSRPQKMKIKWPVQKTLKYILRSMARSGRNMSGTLGIYANEKNRCLCYNLLNIRTPPSFVGA